MKSLAYVVAFILACIVIGGPIALSLTFVRVRRYKNALIKSVFSILLATLSILLGLVLILNSGSIGSKLVGFIGLGTGIPAILRSARQVRNFR